MLPYMAEEIFAEDVKNLDIGGILNYLLVPSMQSQRSLEKGAEGRKILLEMVLGRSWLRDVQMPGCWL